MVSQLYGPRVVAGGQGPLPDYASIHTAPREPGVLELLHIEYLGRYRPQIGGRRSYDTRASSQVSSWSNRRDPITTAPPGSEMLALKRVKQRDIETAALRVDANWRNSHSRPAP